VKLVFANMSDALPQVRSGTLKSLAVTTRTRSPQAPDVPTLEESGISDFNVESWNGLLAPKGTAKEIVDKLAQALAAMAQDETVKKRFSMFGSQTAANTPAEWRKLLEAETVQWRGVLEAAGVAKPR
jgi:tripartite-type tricarboxylate transporter receptor subunit TctC